jgi:hypothetical protein
MALIIRNRLVILVRANKSASMSTVEPPSLNVTAKSIIATYIDPLPAIPMSESSRYFYDKVKNSQETKATVSHFNQVRFLAKFRQMEVHDELDYLTCFEEMKRFNQLS